MDQLRRGVVGRLRREGGRRAASGRSAIVGRSTRQKGVEAAGVYVEAGRRALGRIESNRRQAAKKGRQGRGRVGDTGKGWVGKGRWRLGAVGGMGSGGRGRGVSICVCAFGLARRRLLREKSICRFESCQKGAEGRGYRMGCKRARRGKEWGGCAEARAGKGEARGGIRLWAEGRLAAAECRAGAY